MITPQLISTITCPICGNQKEETMPTDACQFFYECEKCKTVLKPNSGDYYFTWLLSRVLRNISK